MYRTPSLTDVPLRLSATTTDGHFVSVSPTRARAITRLPGFQRLARGQGRCPPCALSRLVEVVRGAARVGRLRASGSTYVVFAIPALRVRLLARPATGGAYALLSLERVRPAAPPPRYLGALDLAELEGETKVLPMQARVVWHREPLTLAAARARFGASRHHLLYVAVDKAGRARKVGESSRFDQRYTDQTAGAKGFEKFYVGRVVSSDGTPLMGPYVKDAERLVARKLARMGVRLAPEAHKRPSPNEPIVTSPGEHIRLASAVPAALRKRRLTELRGAKPSLQRRTQLSDARRASVHVDGDRTYELGASGI